MLDVILKSEVKERQSQDGDGSKGDNNMYIKKLEVYSALLNESTQKLQVAIEATNIELIQELSIEIKKLAAKVAKYSEKSELEVERTIEKIESGGIKKVVMFSNENHDRVEKLEVVYSRLQNLIIDTAANGNDNSSEIEALNNEHYELTKDSAGVGYSFSMDSESKHNNAWSFTGHTPITMVNFNELTFKETKKGIYLYNGKAERFVISYKR